MFKLVKNKTNIQIEKCDYLELQDNFVKIKVEYVGLCRTDLFVANGTIERDFDIVLGHEFSGRIVDSKSKNFKVNDYVIVNPLFLEKGFMGLDFDGCLQEFVNIPEEQVHKYKNMSGKVAAYIEPVVASMATLKVMAICKMW